MINPCHERSIIKRTYIDSRVPTRELKKFLSIINVNGEFTAINNESLLLSINSSQHSTMELLDLLQKFLINHDEEYNELFVKTNNNNLEICYPENQDLILLSILKKERKLIQSKSEVEYYRQKLIKSKCSLNQEEKELNDLKRKANQKILIKTKTNFSIQEI